MVGDPNDIRNPYRTLGRYQGRQTALASDVRTAVYSSETAPADDAPFFYAQPQPGGGLKLIPLRAGNAGQRGILTGYHADYAGFAAGMPRELRDNHEGRVLAYKASVWAFVCVNKRARALAGLPRIMRDRQTDKPVYEHPLLTAIDNAYAHHFQRFMEVYERSLALHGMAFIEPIQNGFVWNALHVLNPLAVDLRLQYNALVGFDYHASSMVHFDLNELFYDKLDDPASDLIGQSLMSLALDKVNVSRDMALYTQGFFRADGVPAGIITARQGFSPSKIEADDFLERWRQEKTAKGVNAKFDIKFVPGPFEFNQIQREPVPEDVKLSEQAQEEICAVFEVPRAIAGAIVDANYQTREQRLEWHETTIATIATARAEFINIRVKPLFDPANRYYFEFDIDTALDRLGRPQRMYDITNRRLANGEITLNEARSRMGDEPLPGGDVLYIPNNVTLTPKDQLTAVATATPTAPTIDQAVQGVVLETVQRLANPLTVSKAAALKDGVPSATAILRPDNESVAKIKAVAARLREMLPDPAIQWTPDYQYHITLVHAELITNDQLDYAISQVLPFRPFAVTTQGVSTFDNDTVAIVLPIAQTPDLSGYQRDLYHMAFAQDGVVVSEHSYPEDWQPHITLAYAPAGTQLPEIDIDPSSFEVDLTFDILHVTRPEYEIVGQRDADTETAENELDKWHRKAKKAVKAQGITGASVAFETSLIRDEIADGLRAALAEAADVDAVRLAFDRARELVMWKAIQATRLDFENACADLLHQATSGQVTRSAFSNKMRALIRNYGRDAYRDGLTDGGMTEPGFDDDDVATINRLVAEQSQYVTALGEVLFKGDGISPAQEEARPAMWYRKSIEPFYKAGVGSADRNGLYEWVLGRTEEHCKDCLRLNGQKHRMKDWLRRNLIPQSDRLACGGWLCDCKLKKTNGRATGRF